MKMEFLLPLLHKVHRTAKGYMALCPAHKDVSPSLSLRETDDRILMHCFAGCSILAICEALGISIKELFIKNHSSAEIKKLQREGQKRRQAEYKRRILEGLVIDARREAEALLKTCHGQNISLWTNEYFDRVMNVVGQALALLRDEDEENFYENIG